MSVRQGAGKRADDPAGGARAAERKPGEPLLLGVRHHGPGSARAVLAALEEYRPATVLVEGPPEGDALLRHVAEETMRPPVALLAYAADDPGRAAFWPLAEFSPEWVAIRWALQNDVPVRFFDLPAAHAPALTGEEEPPGPEPVTDGPDPTSGGGDPPADPSPDRRPHLDPQPGVPDRSADPEPSPRSDLRIDPLAALAEAAGYDDPERWWEDVVEHRGDRAADAAADPYAPFQALGEAMAALRESYGDGGHQRDLVREAHMRLRLREARQAADGPVAVVCGAWHVPALTRRTTVTADRRLLKGLPKVRTEMTWVPWTHQRLARHSGYGAGITSPGWYGHLFTAPDRPIERWMTRVAGLLRDEDRMVSSAHVIEAVRLAEALAAMRGRPLAGLSEVTDAVRSVLCEGSDVPLALIHDRLIVGDELGEVPETAPVVPLQRDLSRTQRTLRLKPQALQRELELDLRRDNDAARSRLLHQLRLLEIDWGAPVANRGSTGTFRETWELCWRPELSVRVAEAGVWGTTIRTAASAKARSLATSAGSLAEVTALAESCLLAGLGDALPVVMRALADRAALDSDVGHLAQALPALVRTVRYGDVRGTDSAALSEVARGLAGRVCVGFPPACAGLDPEGAASMRQHLDAAHQAITLLDPEKPGEPGGGELARRWTTVLRQLAERDRIPGLLRGRCSRLLLDDGRLAEDGAARLMGLALSPGTTPTDAAAWVEGFLSGGGVLLLHDDRLLGLLDGWLAGVSEQAFTDVLPLLRRTFSAFESGVRRSVGELVRRGPGAGRSPEEVGESVSGFAPDLDPERAEAVLPTLRLLLGPGAGAAARPDDLAGVAR